MDNPKYVSLTNHVAEYIRGMIFRNELKPGDKIAEQRIAEIVGTSRGPVRDGLLMLEKQGLVKKVARKGAFVIELNEEDIYEICSLRSAIEQLAVQRLTSLVENVQIERLYEICKRTKEALRDEAPDHVSLAEIDMDFHHELVLLSKHARALNAWQSEGMLCTLLSIRARSSLDENEIADEHRRIVDAIAHKNHVLACQILSNHIESSCKDLINTLKKTNAYKIVP